MLLLHVLVSDHDKVIFKKGYGLADREWNIPNTPDAKFRIGSITKQFTSMLVMQQVAKGTVRLEDLYKWDQALYTDKLIPDALKQKLFTPI
jgi:hypothetical protein